jgi:hypothetical protein
MIVDRRGLIQRVRLASFEKNPDEPNKEIMDMIFYGNFEKFVTEGQKEKEIDECFLETDTKEISNKNKNIILWIIGVSLLFAIPLLFYLKKRLICKKKSKKNYETKR